MEIIHFAEFKKYLKKINKLLSYYDLKDINELQNFLTINNNHYNKYLKECNMCDERFINEEYSDYFDKDTIDRILERELDITCPCCLLDMQELLEDEEVHDDMQEENDINLENQLPEISKNNNFGNDLHEEDGSVNIEHDNNDGSNMQDNKQKKKEFKTKEFIITDDELDGCNIQDEKELHDIQIQQNEENKNVKINKESEKIINKIQNNYYHYHDKIMPLLPGKIINNNICKINTLTKNKQKINIEMIIEFSKMYEEYIIIYKDNQCKNTFEEFIVYENYNTTYFDNLYLKIKKCHEFITFLKNNEITEENIIEIVFRSDLSYTKLFKVKNDDYTKLKQFYIDIYNNKLNKGDIEKKEQKEINLDKI